MPLSRVRILVIPAACLVIASSMAGCRLTEPVRPISTAVEIDSANHGRRTARTFDGPALRVGDGIARATYTVGHDGEPRSIGLHLSRKALEGLGEKPRSWVFTFHPKAGSTQYTHMLVDWNPQGHEPPGIYDVPHFDFHFYWASIAEREAIGPNDAAAFAAEPAAKYVPPAYLHTPGGVPQMGAHWVDLKAPEFTGGHFSRTLIWGSYDGHFIFIEPMITLAYLQNSPHETFPLRQPPAFERSGYYPRNYSVATDRHGNIDVRLEDLCFHRASKHARRKALCDIRVF